MGEVLDSVLLHSFQSDSFTSAQQYFNLWIESVKDAAIKDVTEIAEIFE